MSIDTLNADSLNEATSCIFVLYRDVNLDQSLITLAEILQTKIERPK